MAAHYVQGVAHAERREIGAGGPRGLGWRGKEGKGREREVWNVKCTDLRLVIVSIDDVLDLRQGVFMRQGGRSWRRQVSPTPRR